MWWILEPLRLECRAGEYDECNATHCLASKYKQWMTARYLIDTVKVAAELKEEEERGFVGRDEIQRVVHLVMHQEEGNAMQSSMVEVRQSAAKYACSNSYLESFVDGLSI